MNPTLKTLGELLAYKDSIIRRNSMSILKRLQKIGEEIDDLKEPLCNCNDCVADRGEERPYK